MKYCHQCKVQIKYGTTCGTCDSSLSNQSACSAAMDRGVKRIKPRNEAQSRGAQPALLPCPFCGSAPQTTSRASDVTATRKMYFVACMCGGHSAKAHQYGESFEDVASKWNRRARPST